MRKLETCRYINPAETVVWPNAQNKCLHFCCVLKLRWNKFILPTPKASLTCTWWYSNEFSTYLVAKLSESSPLQVQRLSRSSSFSTISWSGANESLAAVQYQGFCRWQKSDYTYTGIKKFPSFPFSAFDFSARHIHKTSLNCSMQTLLQRSAILLGYMVIPKGPICACQFLLLCSFLQTNWKYVVEDWNGAVRKCIGGVVRDKTYSCHCNMQDQEDKPDERYISDSKSMIFYFFVKSLFYDLEV